MILGSLLTRASIMIPKVSCICVCLKRRFKIIFAFTSRRNSITMRIPSLSDSSRRSVMPSIFFNLTSSAIFNIRLALFTIYGSSVTMIRVFPLAMVSISVTARTLTLPRPVLYASSLPLVPRIIPPVGKSGAFTIERISSISVSLSSRILLSIIFTIASTTSLKL